MYELIFKNGPRKSERIPLAAQRIPVGRAYSNAILVDDLAASRHHLTFHIDNGQLFVEDEKSSLGTYINDLKIQRRAEVKTGDTIRFGKTKIQIMNITEVLGMGDQTAILERSRTKSTDDDRTGNGSRETDSLEHNTDVGAAGPLIDRDLTEHRIQAEIDRRWKETVGRYERLFWYGLLFLGGSVIAALLIRLLLKG